MQVDGILVDVEAIDHIRPSPSPIEAPEQAADLKTGIGRLGLGRIDRDAEHTLRHRLWPHRDVGKGRLDRKRFPARPVIDAADDRTGLISGEDSLRMMRMARERPHREARRRSREPAPSVAAILAAPDAVLRSNGDPAGVSGIGQYRADLRRGRYSFADRFPAAFAVVAAVEP